jgi:hypothetical protein
VDAFRGRDERQPPPAEESNAVEGRAIRAATLSAFGARGELRLHDGACGETVFSLPSLRRRPARSLCVPVGAVSPDGLLVARCLDEGVEIYSTVTGALVRLAEGCEPAWRPDGELTVAHGNEIVGFDGCGELRTCAKVLVPRGELERAASLHPIIRDRLSRVRALVDGIAWLSERSVAVNLSIRPAGRRDALGPLSAVAVFDDGRLGRLRHYLRSSGGRLASSPRGTYVTLGAEVILRRDGSRVHLPEHLRPAQDLAWSPDERFLAVATRFAVVVLSVASLERYDATGGGLRSVTLPLAAARLAWAD